MTHHAIGSSVLVNGHFGIVEKRVSCGYAGLTVYFVRFANGLLKAEASCVVRAPENVVPIRRPARVIPINDGSAA